MWNRLIRTINILLATILLLSCGEVTGVILDLPSASPVELPPFVISKPAFEIIERPYHFRYAGIVFKFFNQAEEIVDKITVSFLLFDSRTLGNPFMGSNKFEITIQDIVFPDENKELTISLDRFIHIAPTDPYLIDFFYIYEIHYVNGSVWQDKYGKYRVRN